MKKIIKDLYQLDRYLLGEGYDKSLEYINNIIPLDILEFPSGKKVGGSWDVPQEWVIRDAWVKFNGEKIIDWQKDKMAVSQGSSPIHETITLEELKKHLNVSETKKDATPYHYHFYDGGWSFNLPYNQCKKLKSKDGMVCENGVCVPELKDVDPEVGKVQIEGVQDEYEDLLKEGEYEVFIDSEYKPGIMKVGVHTIKGKSDREILLFAHLDHPWQANDNLSSVACLIDMVKKINCDHTVKIIFCPETIGSIAFGEQYDNSNVDFTISLECVGTNNPLFWQKSFDAEAKINRVTHLAVTGLGASHSKGNFRNLIGSDEYYFNDPKVGVPSIMISRWCNERHESYLEYHTSSDTPDIIHEEKIQEVQEVILKIIEIWENDYIPVKNFKGPVFMSKYGIHTPVKELNRAYDYLLYLIDGKRSLAELVCELGLNFDFTYEAFEKMLSDGIVTKHENSRPYRGKKGKRKAKE